MAEDLLNVAKVDIEVYHYKMMEDMNIHYRRTDESCNNHQSGGFIRRLLLLGYDIVRTHFLRYCDEIIASDATRNIVHAGAEDDDEDKDHRNLYHSSHAGRAAGGSQSRGSASDGNNKDNNDYQNVAVEHQEDAEDENKQEEYRASPRLGGDKDEELRPRYHHNNNNNKRKKTDDDRRNIENSSTLDRRQHARTNSTQNTRKGGNRQQDYYPVIRQQQEHNIGGDWIGPYSSSLDHGASKNRVLCRDDVVPSSNYASILVENNNECTDQQEPTKNNSN